MQRAPAPAPLLLAVSLLALGWIDYDDKVPKTEPKFGKEFQGFQLQIRTEHPEFEQELPEQVTVTIKNTTDRGSLLAPGMDASDRHYALYIVMADEDGQSSRFSRNLLKDGENLVVSGKIPAQAETVLAAVSFDSLEVAAVEEYENGLPYFDPKRQMAKAGTLVPQLYVLKAVLLSSQTGKRPDVAVASDVWPILLQPKSAARMTEDEKRSKMDRYLAKMAEGAYGGIGVSSQLAALGEPAVAPLIVMAEKPGADGPVRESRIWAIVTLCNTGSKQAEEYILKRIQDPIDFGDLAFLVWHSQGLGSERVTRLLQDLAQKTVTGQEMPWEKKHGRDSRGHGAGCLNYILKHFAGRGIMIPDETAIGACRLDDPELVCLAIAVWTPTSPEKALAAVKRFFGIPFVHPNLKRTILRRLDADFQARTFPKGDRDKDLDGAWHQAGMWLAGQKLLTPEESRQFLRTEVLWVRSPDLQRVLISTLQKVAGTEFPVQAAEPLFPQHWVQTWQWALKTGNVPDDLAILFLCNQMRVEGELDDTIKRALLVELKGRLGAQFPLASTAKIDLDEDWPTCGNWLIEKGYFKPPKKKRLPSGSATPPGAKPSPEPGTTPEARPRTTP